MACMRLAGLLAAFISQVAPKLRLPGLGSSKQNTVEAKEGKVVVGHGGN